MVLLSSMTSTLVPALASLLTGNLLDLGNKLRHPTAPPRGAWRLDLHHLEIFFAGAALRAGPVHRNIGPGGAGGNAMLRIACGFVINPPANQAHPSPRIAHVFAHVDRYRLLQSAKL